jgi:hypothetical protein
MSASSRLTVSRICLARLVFWVLELEDVTRLCSDERLLSTSLPCQRLGRSLHIWQSVLKRE